MPEDVEPKIFDVRHAEFHVIVGGETKNIVGIGEDGFGISPTTESTIIRGLHGEVGFNMDPSSGGEGSVALKSTSPDNSYLLDIWQKQYLGELGPIAIEIMIKPGHEEEFGFRKVGVKFAMIVKPPEFRTDEKEAPSYEWSFVGYGYYQEPIA